MGDEPCGIDIEYYAMQSELARLTDENDRLREMVAALWECCAWETDSEGWCDGCDYHDEDNGGCKFEKALRELGIEGGVRLRRHE